MAERRMFSKKVTDDDSFMGLSASAQALYLHLSMAADDDGFCNQVAVSIFKAHASVQDLQALLEQRYIYQFESGVIVIKHWRMANALRKDRYTPTIFQNELAKLDLEENGCYSWLPNGCQTVAKCLPQDRLGKDSKGKDNIYMPSKTAGITKKQTVKRFTPPTVEEVKLFCDEHSYDIDAGGFVDYYNANGWKVGRNSMKDWKAAVRNWERNKNNTVHSQPMGKTSRSEKGQVNLEVAKNAFLNGGNENE